jgi:glycosyltransferase involved in cell wall biosynthesis
MFRALDGIGALDTSARPDIWFYSAHGGKPDLVGPSVAIAYEAGWTISGNRENYPQNFIDAIDRGTRGGLAHADAIITGAHSAKKEIADAYRLNWDRIHVIPFGVDLELFRPQRRDEIETTEFSRLLRGRPFVLFVNSFAPRKNLGIVRSATEQLMHEGFPHCLVLVGKAPSHLGGDLEIIEEQATRQFQSFPDRVIWLKDISDIHLAMLMANADVLCAPSQHEGFGFTVLEAMAAGTPVVVSNKGSLPELVGEAGSVVEPTVDEVATALRAILGDPEPQRLRTNVRRQAQTFSWETTARRWQQVSKETLRAKH